MVNKFLHPNGGSETYVMKLGKCLEELGHEVQYFGMEHENRCVGNDLGLYTAQMDFHGGSLAARATYPVRTIYNAEAARKIRKLLDYFCPDVVHLNNFTYQLTPSILTEIRKWKKSGHSCRVVFTAHDYNLVCPNHMLFNPNTQQLCEKCLGGHFANCTKGRCIHGSKLKSLIGQLEASLWNRSGIYESMDTIICCSAFLKSKMDTNPVFSERTIALHNFAKILEDGKTFGEKQDYVLYFGRYSPEKGIRTLLEACRKLSDVPFVFAGSGPMKDEVDRTPNVRDAGFLTGYQLARIIKEARFCIVPSEWYENCPLSVMESQMYGTPVIASNIGGIPELVQEGKTGELFTAGDPDELARRIRTLWNNREKQAEYAANCAAVRFDTVSQYAQKLLRIYQGDVLPETE